MNTFFWILWWTVALGTLVLYYFFFVGLADGSVSGFNAGTWAAIVLGFPALLAGTYWMRHHEWGKLAFLLISIPAWPMIAYFIFLIAAMVFHPRWN